ncbi:MAG TPA: hypothetical protein VEC11_13370 [Allosphingosinicella sp.]|nr:hypothetical protein [Allosphingosinicella sp.]
MADDDSDSEHPTSAARAAADQAKDKSARNKRLITGAAIGIGSAALVAALLYANRSRKSGRS